MSPMHVTLKAGETVRRHKNQIQVLQVQQEAPAGGVSNFVSLINSAVGIFYK